MMDSEGSDFVWVLKEISFSDNQNTVPGNKKTFELLQVKKYTRKKKC